MELIISRDRCVPYQNMVRSFIDKVYTNQNSQNPSPFYFGGLYQDELAIFNGTRFFDQDRLEWIITFKSESDYTMFALKWS